MTTQLDETTQSLREKILAGLYGNEGKLKEVTLSSDLGVSRTVVRLALGELEMEGLVYRTPNRGFRIRSFTLDEVADAILVRGTLEGMAARLCAEQGLSPQQQEDMAAIIDQMDTLLESGLTGLDSRTLWIDLNGSFHDAVIMACGNKVIEDTIAHLSRMPLVSSRALVFDQSDSQKSLGRVHAAHQDHKTVFDAIVKRQGSRAESCLREHALKSAENKRHSFDAMRAADQSPKLPGLSLVTG